MNLVRPVAARIDAVIFDFGGVITSSPFEAFTRFERERGLPPDFLRRVNATNPEDNAWARFERSAIDLATFDADFAAECEAFGHHVRGREVIALLGGVVRPRMVEAVRTLRSRVKTGLITNNVSADEVEGFTTPEQRRIMALFDHVIESAKAGVRKPDPRIYTMMTDALGVAPAHAVFLDDLGVNLKPARSLGMHTIKVGDPELALAELEALVGFSLGDGQ